MTAALIETSLVEGIATLTLNRPEVLNALNDRLLDEMAAALVAWERDPAVAVVIITGSGQRAFAAGADIAELAGKDPLEMALGSGMQEFFTWLARYSKPTIAAVNGYAFGGGFELALSCDVRIASTTAALGLPELSLGIIPGAGGTQRLSRIVGQGPALYHVLTGTPISAARAYELNVISECVAPETLMERATDLARAIQRQGPAAARLAKLAIRQTQPGLDSGLLVEKLAQAVLFSTTEKREGMAAFLEKRPPNFTVEVSRKDTSHVETA
jgi:enoyl-CoA hydratase